MREKERARTHARGATHTHANTHTDMQFQLVRELSNPRSVFLALTDGGTILFFQELWVLFDWMNTSGKTKDMKRKKDKTDKSSRCRQHDQ